MRLLLPIQVRSPILGVTNTLIEGASMNKTKNYEKNIKKLADRTTAQKNELELIEHDAIANFRGQLGELEAALGMLRMGHHTGWKVLVLIHNKRTLRKYENILGINVREYFPEEGPSADRSLGFNAVKKLGNFWKAVSGDIKVENGREIDS